MLIADFEEKTFEEALNLELATNPRFFAPGQVLEKVVGFDAAHDAQNRLLWRRLGRSRPPEGATLDPTWWANSHRVTLERRLPPFLLNLFIQYKRPGYVTGHRGKEWRHWHTSYFRFQIRNHQQRALAALSKTLRHAGTVVYASPAFVTAEELFAHQVNQRLLASTHLVRVGEVTGHGTYTYVSAVNKGKAHSEPMDVQPVIIGSEGYEPPPGAPEGTSGEPMEPWGLLIAAGHAARTAVKEFPALVGSAEVFERIVGELEMPSHPEYRAIRAFTEASLFASMTGLEWTIVEGSPGR